MSGDENKNPTPSPSAGGRARWFCLKSQPKHEHIAAAHLQQLPPDGGQVEVYLPRIRFRRTSRAATRRGIVWVTEALFPGYLFARFDWQTSLRLVQSARGVRGVVHFGERWPAIPEEVIHDLQQTIGATGLRIIPPDPAPGDEVKIAEGAMRGLAAVVAGPTVAARKDRVAVLMEFLGRQTMIELPRDFLVKQGDERTALLAEARPASSWPGDSTSRTS